MTRTELYDFIAAHMKKHGVPPSPGDAAKGLGTTPGNISATIFTMRKGGFLTHKPRDTSTLRLLKRPPEKGEPEPRKAQRRPPAARGGKKRRCRATENGLRCVLGPRHPGPHSTGETHDPAPAASSPPGGVNVVLNVDRLQLGEIRASLLLAIAFIDRAIAGRSVADVLRGLADQVASVESRPAAAPVRALPSPAPAPRHARRAPRPAPPPPVADDSAGDDDDDEEDAPARRSPSHPLGPPDDLDDEPAAPVVAPSVPTVVGAKYRVIDKRKNGLGDFADMIDAAKHCRRHPDGHVVVRIEDGVAVTQPMSKAS